MSVSYIHCQFSRVVPGSATLQRGFWSRAGAQRSQEEGTGAGLTKWTSSSTLPLKIALAWSCSIGGQPLPHTKIRRKYADQRRERDVDPRGARHALRRADAALLAPDCGHGASGGQPGAQGAHFGGGPGALPGPEWEPGADWTSLPASRHAHGLWHSGRGRAAVSLPWLALRWHGAVPGAAPGVAG